MDTASIIAKLGLDVSEFKQGLVSSTAATTEAVSGINEKLDSLQKGLAAGAIGEFSRRMLENADSIVKLSNNLDVGTDELQSFQFAVRDAGGSTQDANRILETTRTKLDDLRAGNAVTAQSFAALGLSAKDFIGLSLDQALEKISAAYVENRERAGAFVALQDIVGKSSRQSMTALQELGEKGFGALVENANAAHAVISGSTLRDLSEAKNKLEEFTNVVTVVGSYILDIFLKIGSAIGIALAAFVALNKAQMQGLFSREGRQELINTLQASGEEFKKLFTSSEAVADSTKKTKDALAGQLPPLVESAALVAQRQKTEELALKAALEGADADTKIAALQADIAAHLQRIVASRFDENVMAKEAAAIAKDTAALKKIQLEQHDLILASTIKQLDAERKQLPLYEQSAVLQKEIALLHADIADKAEKHLDATKQIAALASVETELARTRQKLAEDEVRAAADLVSLDEKRSAQGKLHLELLTGETTRMQILQELQILMSRNIDELNASERLRLQVLFDELTPQEKQQELQTLLIGGVDNLTDRNRALLSILNGQTQAYRDQVKQVQDLTTAYEGYSVAVGRTGTTYENQSVESLRGVLQRLRQQLVPGNPDINLDYGDWLRNSQLNQQIAQVNNELSKRAAVVDFLKRNGEAATVAQFGDSLTQQAEQTLGGDYAASKLDKTNAALASIDTQLKTLTGS
jgi:hypothetical protein